MKKNLMTKCKVVAVMGLAVICIVACKGNNEDEKAIETTIDAENETKYDVDGKIAEAKSEADVIEKKLAEDDTLTQTEMNQLAGKIHIIWDNTMNDMLKALEEIVDENTMKDIKKEQQDWKTEFEKIVKEVQAEFDGGSIAALVGAQKAAELTEERVNELKEYFMK